MANPIVHKSQSDITYVDYTSTKELMENSKIDPHVKQGDIVAVDINLAESGSTETLQTRGPFDYIVASHVFEYLPNLLEWLEKKLGLLCEGGIISLAIPDKRYTFDYFRRLSEPSDWLTAYIDSNVRPTTAQLLNHFLNVRVVNTQEAWDKKPILSNCPRYHDDEIAMDLTRKGQLDYVDCHCFVYTDSSFIAIFNVLQSMNLMLNLETVEIFPPERATPMSLSYLYV